MATAQLPVIRQHRARAPFCFNSAAHLTRILPDRAEHLGDLLEALRTCPDEAIFQHTFQTLAVHHFIREGFSNDFAHWVFSSCNEPVLAEQFASIDVREFTSIGALRERFVAVVSEYLKTHPRARERVALEPFQFCATDTVILPAGFVAHDLAEFAGALRSVSVHCIHYHFIEARLRLKLYSNDFSVWLERDLGLPEMAERVNAIDMYRFTLNDIRREVIRIVEGEDE